MEAAPLALSGEDRLSPVSVPKPFVEHQNTGEAERPDHLVHEALRQVIVDLQRFPRRVAWVARSKLQAAAAWHRARAMFDAQFWGILKQQHGTMKDAQGILRHASIKTTADVYMQEIPESTRAAINSRTRAVLAEKQQETRKSSEAMLPKFRKVDLQVPEKIGSSGRTRIHVQT